MKKIEEGRERDWEETSIDNERDYDTGNMKVQNVIMNVLNK